MTPPRRWWFAAAAGGWMAFIAYGSFVPFDYQPREWADATAEFGTALGRWATPSSRSDFVANVALGVPLGFALLGAVGVSARRGLAALLAPVAVLAAGVFAAGVEFGQLYFRERVCSGADVLAQAVGAAAGAAVWIGGGRWITNKVRGTLGTAPLLFGYAGLVLLALTLPLDLTASPYDLAKRLKEATWVPLGEVLANPQATPESDLKAAVVWAELFALYVPLGLLLAGLPGRFRTANGLPPVAGLGLLFAAAMEGLQVFVVSRHPSVSDVLAGGLGVVLGWAAARVLAERGVRKYRVEVALGVGQGWVVLLALSAWHPFEFYPAAVGDRLAAITWLPLRESIQGHYLWAVEDLLGQFARFVTLGAGAAWATGGRGKRPKVWAAAAVCAAAAVLLELGQAMLPVRVVSPTDVLVATAGGLAGGWAVRRGFRPASGGRPPAGDFGTRGLTPPARREGG